MTPSGFRFQKIPSQTSEDYRLAAEKHLFFCEYMLDSLKDTHTKLKDIDLDHLLNEVFYLAGYIIECSVNFFIYNYFNWSKPVYDFKNEAYEVCFWRSKGDTRYRYVISDHNYRSKIELLDSLIGGSHFLDVPIIGGDKLGYSQTTCVLFNMWSPKVRYETSCCKHRSLHSFMAIQSFVKLASEINIKLLEV